MKIKITENQYSKIRLILEQEEYLTQFKNFCNQKTQEVNELYTKVINASIADIVFGNINVTGLLKNLEKIENDIDVARRNIENLWNQGLIANDDDFDLVIWEIADSVTNKINPLESIFNGLVEIQANTKGITSQFSDIKPIEIQSF